MIKNIVILNAVLYSTLLCASEQPLLTTQLNSAIEKFDVQEVERLLGQGASAVAPVDDKGRLPIEKLVAWTVEEISYPKEQIDHAAKIAFLLLQKGADPNTTINGGGDQRLTLVAYLADWLCQGLSIFPLIEPLVYDKRFSPYTGEKQSVEYSLASFRPYVDTTLNGYDAEAFYRLDRLVRAVYERRKLREKRQIKR